MQDKGGNGRLGKILLLIALLLSVTAFGYRVYSDYYQMPIDYLIFLKSARDFQETGKLYQRTENYEQKYGPSSAIYKFPPPFQLAFVPLAKLPREVNQLSFIKPLLIGMYLLSLFILYRHIREIMLLTGEQRFYFLSALLITASWFMPFFESLRWLLAEIPILLFLMAGFLLERKGKLGSYISGTAIAFLACIKIYPAFMAGNLLREKNYPALAGLITGGFTVLLLSIYVFGIDEHIFYADNILPVLLNEPVISKWVNLNLEKFIYSLGLIPEVTGTIFSINRIVIISIFLGLLLKHHNRLLKNQFLAFSFFISTMFFCFPNYWPQYQIYLIIPLGYLMASYLKNPNHGIWLSLLILATFVLFIPDNLWKNSLILHSQILSIISIVLYETRSLSTLIIWVLIAREIHLLRVRVN